VQFFFEKLHLFKNAQWHKKSKIASTFRRRRCSEAAFLDLHASIKMLRHILVESAFLGGFFLVQKNHVIVDVVLKK